MVLLGIGLAAVLAREANQVVDQLPSYIDKLNAFTRDHFDLTVFSASQRAAAADAGTHLNEFLKDHQDDILGGVASGVSAIFTLFTIGLFRFYLTAQGPQVRRALLPVPASTMFGRARGVFLKPRTSTMTASIETMPRR